MTVDGRTAVSFYLDDVGPYVTEFSKEGKPMHPVPVSALEEFAEFVKEQGLAGAVSVIPGLNCLLTEPKNDLERDYAKFVGRLSTYNLDAHMEIMTHGPLFNFDEMKPIEGTSEAEWLDDPNVPLEEYLRYFRNTIRVGRKLGVTYTGLSTPGTHPKMNPNVWKALARLADEGEFPNPAVPVFAVIDESPPVMRPVLVARSGRGASYDMPSGVWDYIASWRNSPDWIDVDRYLTPQGKGRMADLIRNGSPTAIFHMHWQGLNPATGLGWPAFQELIRRLNDQFGDRIVWKRPSEIALEAYKNLDF
ncbi:MAG: putative secreted protein [Candidatus Bathyarchaeota archaeon B26-1]|nr:MAG: putative secreted protein [Candidatus Bathyarchaeota archaeon B26-1]